MRLDEAECRRRFAASRVAVLATASSDARPHVVPVTFALVENVIVIAVDAKPKTTKSLRRLRNIDSNGQVAVLAHHYADDWAELWWVRADGRARIGGEPSSELVAKYPPYAEQPPDGPWIRIDVTAWSGWSFA